jgi:prepilin-type N-terminal cleavage/methylation domain-containing protein
MLQKLRNREKGFTIIEVLIVLAIAGLILLIVFLAVPALQRSSRNTQRKNDAAAVGGAIANFISNNGGTIPTLLGNNASTSDLDVCNTGGSATQGGIQACTGNLETAKMGYYVSKDAWIANGSAGNVTPASGTGAGQLNPTTIVIEYGEACNDSNTGGGAANPRTAAIFYATENGTSANGVVQCVEQ